MESFEVDGIIYTPPRKPYYSRRPMFEILDDIHEGEPGEDDSDWILLGAASSANRDLDYDFILIRLEASMSQSRQSQKPSAVARSA